MLRFIEASDAGVVRRITTVCGENLTVTS